MNEEWTMKFGEAVKWTVRLLMITLSVAWLTYLLMTMQSFSFPLKVILIGALLVTMGMSVLDARGRRLKTVHEAFNSLDDLSDHLFTSLVKEVFKSIGYQMNILLPLSKLQNCYEGLVMARKDELSTIIWCEPSKEPIGASTISKLVGLQKQHRARTAFIVSRSSFTEEAISLAKANEVILIERGTFLKMVEEAKTYLESTYLKGTLKWVYKEFEKEKMGSLAKEPFKEWVVNQCENSGCETESPMPAFGVDLIVYKNKHAMAVQCKGHGEYLTEEQIGQLQASMNYFGLEEGLIVSNMPIPKSLLLKSKKQAVAVITRHKLSDYLDHL